METIDWTRFTRRAAVKAPMNVIYDAWTKASEIEKWFLKTAEYTSTNKEKRPADENFQKGDSYIWTWFNYDGKEENNIIEANGKDFISFGFAGQCIVEINLSEVDGMVIIELTQTNIPTDEKSKSDIRLGCDRGWSYYLVNIKSFYENGNDLRLKDSKIHKAVYAQ